MMRMDEYLSMLGYRVKDRVTGFSGIVTSITFDLYGCVQALLNSGMDKEGKQQELQWFDFKRLEIIDHTPVMEQPTFAAVPGGQALPKRKETPLP